MSLIISTEEYLETPRPSLTWIVDGHVPYPGSILLMGPPKSGKSFLALDMARSIAQGVPFLGWVTKQSRVLYLQFDTGELVWRQRLEKIVASGTPLSGALFTVHPDEMKLPINILKPEDRSWLNHVVSTSECDVFVVDVLREIHSADENDSTQMKIVGDIITNIFRGKTLILVHHSKKLDPQYSENPSPSDASRGSSYLTGKVDSLWLLLNGQLKIQGRSQEPTTRRLTQSPSGLWIPAPIPPPQGQKITCWDNFPNPAYR